MRIIMDHNEMQGGEGGFYVCSEVLGFYLILADAQQVTFFKKLIKYEYVI